MIFENYEEYNKLISEVVSSIRAGSDKTIGDEQEIVDDESIGGDVPLDEVLPPSKGQGAGSHVNELSANTTDEQTYYGGPWIAGRLEERLCSLLEDLAGGNDQTSNSQQSTSQGAVGSVGILGHGGATASTEAAKRRGTADPMTALNKAGKAKDEPEKSEAETKDDESEDMKDQMKSLGLDAGEAAAITPI